MDDGSETVEIYIDVEPLVARSSGMIFKATLRINVTVICSDGHKGNTAKKILDKSFALEKNSGFFL